MNKKLKNLLILFVLILFSCFNNGYSISVNSNVYKAKSTITNYESTGLKLSIQDNSGMQISGIVVGIYDGSELIDRFTTTESEYINNNISSGTYTIEIESVPDGYEKEDEATNTVEIKDKATTSVLIVLNNTSENDQMYKLLISDIDNSTGDELIGCNIFIYNEDGSEYEHFVTNGDVKILEVPSGSYRIVQEDNCSDFYTKVNSDINITIDNTKSNYPVQITNKLVTSITSTSGISSSTVAIILGIVIILSGIGLIFITKKNNHK